MLRTMFAMAVAGSMLAAASGTSQAAPIAPLPERVISQTGVATPVYYHRYHHPYWHHRYYHRHYWHRHYWHHRHCWRGYYGRLHCRW